MNIFINENEQRVRAGWRLLVQFVVMIFLYGISALLISELLPGSWIITSVIPLFLGVCLSVWFAARHLDRRPLAHYGINFNSRWGKEFMVGSLIGSVAVGVMFLIEWSAGWIAITHYGWNVTSQPSFGVGFTTFFFSMLMVGFHEELLFRGYQISNINEGLQYQRLGFRSPIIIAVILTSSIFGLLHFFNPNASVISTFNIVLAGIVLATPYILTGSLALSVGLHFSWNFVMAGIAGFPVSGLPVKTSILKIKQDGIELWTGGAFGPEAGVIGLLGMAIMLGGSCIYIKQAGYELRIATLFIEKYRTTVKSDEQSQ